MKITYTPANTADTFTFEGETVDILLVMDRLLAGRSGQFSFLSPEAAKTTPPTISPDNSALLDAERREKIDKFLASAYVYAANNKTDGGKGRWIAERLMTFNRFDIKTLAKSANATVATVHNNIERLRSHGAVIDVDTTYNTVQVMSFPENKQFRRKRRTVKTVVSAKATKPAVKAGTPINMSALKGMQLDPS